MMRLNPENLQFVAVTCISKVCGEANHICNNRAHTYCEHARHVLPSSEFTRSGNGYVSASYLPSFCGPAHHQMGQGR
jgi:hypothetical protein